MGWSLAGNTRQKYQHYYNDDSFDAMLVIDGIVTPAAAAKSKARNLLKPKMCPNCDESNKPESKFCGKCKFVLSFDAYNEVTNEAEKQKKQVQDMAQDFENMKVELAKVYGLVEKFAFEKSKDMLTIQKQQAKLGEIPPLCAMDTLGIVSDNGIYLPELDELMFIPWAELEKPQNKKKLMRLEELLRKVQKKGG
jgi:hypothetical protein